MFLASVSSRLLLHDTNSFDLKKSYGCYNEIIRDISWSDDSKYILQVNAKGLIEILNPGDHDIRSAQHVPYKDTWSASFHREGHRHIAVGTKIGNVMVWDTKNKTVAKTFPSPSQQSSVNFISYNARNTSLASSLQNGDTIIYGLVSNIPMLTIKLPCSKSISAMKFHHESRSLLGFGTDEGHIVLHDISTNKNKSFFENIHESPVSDFTFSLMNKDILLSCGFDKIMHVYDIKLHNVVSTIRTSHTLTSIAMNSENQVALGSNTGHILLYDLRDLTNPYKILKDHEEEIKKIAFQPIRKNTLSEISLSETVPINFPLKARSPVPTKKSDMFFMNDTPPKSTLDISGLGDNKADSFLVMMGLDNSNGDFDDDVNKTTEFERCSDRLDVRGRQLDTVKNISIISTPLNSQAVENLMVPSPMNITNGVTNYADCSNNNLKQTNNVPVSIDPKVVAELKDFIKDVAYDNKNYYLSLMMELTKQKLYLSKQLASMNEQMQNVLQKQWVILQNCNNLELQIDQLNAKKNTL